MNYGRYSRSATVLSEQGRDFAGADGRLEGRLRIETGNNKGAIRCNVENLRPYIKGDYLYKLILFGVRGERTIHAVVGTIPVGRSGKGEAYFRFNPLDVNGKGDEYEYFTTAIVAAVSMRDEQEPLHPVLKGSTGNEPKTGFTDKGSEKTCSEGESQLIQKLAEDKAKDKAKDDAKDDAIDQNLIQQNPSGEKKLDKKNIRLFNRFYNQHILHSCIHTCQVAEYYEEVKPFDQDRTGARWKKIMNIASLPLVSPGAHYFASLYHHYLFGARPDERGYASCYFFAIPGRNMETEQPDGGQSGFVYWQPMKGSEGQKNPYGYWIVEIDGQTGDIRQVSIEKTEKM